MAISPKKRQGWPWASFSANPAARKAKISVPYPKRPCHHRPLTGGFSGLLHQKTKLLVNSEGAEATAGLEDTGCVRGSTALQPGSQGSQELP